jgi:hypothetical protein
MRGSRIIWSKRSRAAFGSGALILAHGCGSDSNAGSNATSGDAEAFIQDFCEAISGCCDGAGKTFDSARCTSLQRAEASGHLLGAAHAEQCLEGLRAAKANGTLCDWRTDVRDPCLVVFTGGKQPGDSCIATAPSECAPSPEGEVTCFQSPAEKICLLRIDGNEGDSPCLTTQEGSSGHGGTWNGADPARGYVCETAKGLLCDPATKACARAPDIGATCDRSIGSYSCGSAGYCDAATTKCIARPATGGDCTAAGVICALGTYCDATTSRCTPQLANGAPCSTSEMCTGDACLQDVCGGNNAGFLTTYCK